MQSLFVYRGWMREHFFRCFYDRIFFYYREGSAFRRNEMNLHRMTQIRKMNIVRQLTNEAAIVLRHFSQRKPSKSRRYERYLMSMKAKSLKGLSFIWWSDNMEVTILFLVAFSTTQVLSLDCSAECRPDASCCSEEICSDNNHDSDFPAYIGM